MLLRARRQALRLPEGLLQNAATGRAVGASPVARCVAVGRLLSFFRRFVGWKWFFVYIWNDHNVCLSTHYISRKEGNTLLLLYPVDNVGKSCRSRAKLLILQGLIAL